MTQTWNTLNMTQTWNIYEKTKPEYNKYLVLYDKEFSRIPKLAQLRENDGDWKGDHWVSEKSKRMARNEDLWIYVDLPAFE